MSEVRDSIKGKPRRWRAVGMKDRTIYNGSEVQTVTLVQAVDVNNKNAGVQGIFRIDEWRRLELVK